MKRRKLNDYSLKELDKKLLQTIQKWARIRDAYDNGWSRCHSCDKPIKWNRGAHGGHFQPATRYPTRFNEKNINSQCAYCNRFLEGNQVEYAKRIDKKYGKGTADELTTKSKMRHAGYNREYYIIKIKHYRVEIKRLKREKGL